MVNGIAVAVAGAIALQMLFAGVESDYTKQSQNDLSRAQMQLHLPDGVPVNTTARQLAATKGVRKVTALSNSTIGDKRKDPTTSSDLSIGDCAALRELATLPSCHDGDVFVLRGAEYDTDTPKLVAPGRKLYLDPSYGSEHRRRWPGPCRRN